MAPIALSTCIVTTLRRRRRLAEHSFDCSGRGLPHNRLVGEVCPPVGFGTADGDEEAAAGGGFEIAENETDEL